MKQINFKCKCGYKHTIENQVIETLNYLRAVLVCKKCGFKVFNKGVFNKSVGVC